MNYAYYNDNNKFCCDVLRKNVARGLLPGGKIKSRQEPGNQLHERYQSSHRLCTPILYRSSLEPLLRAMTSHGQSYAHDHSQLQTLWKVDTENIFYHPQIDSAERQLTSYSGSLNHFVAACSPTSKHMFDRHMSPCYNPDRHMSETHNTQCYRDLSSTARGGHKPMTRNKKQVH